MRSRWRVISILVFGSPLRKRRSRICSTGTVATPDSVSTIARNEPSPSGCGLEDCGCQETPFQTECVCADAFESEPGWMMSKSLPSRSSLRGSRNAMRAPMFARSSAEMLEAVSVSACSTRSDTTDASAARSSRSSAQKVPRTGRGRSVSTASPCASSATAPARTTNAWPSLNAVISVIGSSPCGVAATQWLETPPQRSTADTNAGERHECIVCLRVWIS